jgi:hypothetical protein
MGLSRASSRAAGSFLTKGKNPLPIMKPDSSSNSGSLFNRADALGSILSSLCAVHYDRARHEPERGNGGFVLAPLVQLGSALDCPNCFNGR